MDRVQEFLEIYRQLEEALEEKYPSRRKGGSVVMEYLSDEESKPFHDIIDKCREIRNLLTHNASFNGEPILQPSVSLVNGLKDALEYVKKPPLALDFATKGDKIMRADINKCVLPLLKSMNERGFSHIPVTKNGQFFGVFSADSLGLYFIQSGGGVITADTKLSELSEYLDVSKRKKSYEFVPMTETYISARQKFEHIRGKNERISAIFITKTGHIGERLLGVLTPWDVMGDKKQN